MTKKNTSSTPCHRRIRGARPVKWVSFVGSGPGDPGLLTVRAVELLREAEIVITEVPDHEQLRPHRPRPPRPGARRPEAETDGEPPSRSARSSWTAASARTASR